tara:strand:+ start:135 stop:575 length:441 start_codon:yes stop_codon:yes gene_type:complete
MAISIEEALLAKAQQDQQNQMSTGTAALLGSGAGALAGAAAGAVPYEVGNQINKLKDRLRGGETLVSGPMQNMRKAVRPGPRFAGGLVGAILGGALGAGAQQAAMQDNPAAVLLAKLQTEGSLTSSETQQLQSVLADTYSNITGVA